MSNRKRKINSIREIQAPLHALNVCVLSVSDGEEKEKAGEKYSRK